MHRALYAWPLLTIAAAAAAGPLHAERLPADAAWVFHADLELAGVTRLGRFTLHEIESELAPTAIGQLNIRAGRDVKDITLFGWEGEPPTGIFLATMTDSADRVFEHVAGRKDYERLERDGKTIHSWTEHADLADPPPQPAPGEQEEGEPGEIEARVEAGAGGVRVRLHHNGPDRGVRLYAINVPAAENRLVLATDDMDALLRAIRVLDGQAASRDGATPAPGEALVPVDIPADAFLFVAATDPAAFGHDQAHANIARMADVLTLAIGERDDKAFIDLRLNARTQEEAVQIASVLQGLVALAQLSVDPKDPQAAWVRDLARSVTFAAEGSLVTAVCRFDPDVLIKAHQPESETDAQDEPSQEDPADTQENPAESDKDASP